MPTNTAGSTARVYQDEHPVTISKAIAYTDTAKVVIGTVPKGAAVIDAGIIITTAFAGGTPQTLDMGMGSDTDGLATALVLTAAGVMKADVLNASDDIYAASDTEANATLSAGATTSAGAGYVFVTYVMVNRT